MSATKSEKLIQDIAKTGSTDGMVRARLQPTSGRSIVQPQVDKSRYKAKSAWNMAAFTLKNLVTDSNNDHDDLDESVLEEVSHAVTHPSPHRARDFQEAPLKTIAEHINELRRRAIYCAIALFIGGVLGYKFQGQIIAWLTKPLGETLFYTSPAGGFDFLIKICIFFGFLLAIPIIMFNILRFISPAVPRYVTIKTGKILVISISLAITGAIFAYYVSLPAALHFLNGFSTKEIQSLISAQEYFNFVMIYIAGFAVLFQMPLLITFINKVTPLNPKMLMKKQRVLILVSFIIAAVLTPTPDPVNQTIMALPIIFLYQISIIIVWQENRKLRRKRRKARPGFVVEPAGM